MAIKYEECKKKNNCNYKFIYEGRTCIITMPKFNFQCNGIYTFTAAFSYHEHA